MKWEIIEWGDFLHEWSISGVIGRQKLRRHAFLLAGVLVQKHPQLTTLVRSEVVAVRLRFTHDIVSLAVADVVQPECVADLVLPASPSP